MKVCLNQRQSIPAVSNLVLDGLLEVKSSLERRRADVVELYQGMSELMTEIHGAIVQCMSTTLSELRRSNTTVSPQSQLLLD